MVKQLTVRGRKLIDPMNSHEFVECEIVVTPDTVIDTATKLYVPESWDAVRRRALMCLHEALGHAIAVLIDSPK